MNRLEYCFFFFDKLKYCLIIWSYDTYTLFANKDIMICVRSYDFRIEDMILYHMCIIIWKVIDNFLLILIFKIIGYILYYCKLTTVPGGK